MHVVARPFVPSVVLDMVLFTILAALTMSSAAQASARPGQLGLSLHVNGLLHSSGRSISAVIEGAANDQQFDILLLDAQGAEQGKAAVAAGDAFNLTEALPALRDIGTTHWLQISKDGTPIGTPWIAQPLVNRPLVRTTRAMRPDGKTSYTKIIGWGDRLLDPTSVDDAALKVTWPSGEPTPRSGLRIYADRDVVLTTDKGTIRVALAPEFAPNTAWNFRTLTEGGFYDGTPFHRIVKFDRDGRPFVIQGGDPTATGDGSAGYDLPLEPSALQHDFGVISMARSDPPDSAGSQFFFCLSREGTARLDGQYCAFGWAVEGADVIAAIADAEIDDLTTGRPKLMPRITKAELVPAPPRIPGRGRPDGRVDAPNGAPRELPTEPDR
ncbi:MAG: peptidylprolyl isomerase [Phycisphaerae bacterium]|nr:peptidylprolyl isomerase [Phycisphaerae bacterium]